ncbi:unnamed protein product [Ilex paraguariensis]|uniref:Phospho-N-acetylmuramoyl-pentapeptide-transferase n=1 Tax=Ilex paraguariensis TaxID=185542 RepID=A0ABC8RNX8_9AQUA
MWFHSSSSNLSGHSLGFLRSCKRSTLSILTPSRTRISFVSSIYPRRLGFYFDLKVRKYGYRSKQRVVQVTAMADEDLGGIASLDDFGSNERAVEYMLSSSDGEDSDGEGMLTPITDVDLPTKRKQFRPTDDALTVTAHRLAMLGRARKRKRIKYGILNNIGLITFLTMLLLLVDWCAWRIVRLPLAPFYLMRPFSMSAVLAACAGYICVPLLRSLKLQSIIKKRPARHSSKEGTPVMGGLFFIPIGIIVAEVIVGFSSIEVSAAAAATLAFAAIGLLDDFLSLIKDHHNGLSAWMRIFLEVAVGTWFSFWLYSTDISSPYSMYTFS